MSKTTDLAYESWLSGLTLERIHSTLIALHCETVLIKPLKRNNNSKNQIYLAPSTNHLAGLPLGEPIPNPRISQKQGGKTGSLFSIPLRFSWLSPSGVVRAPEAKLCDYTQYPEVRFSGFLKGCADPPSYLMAAENRGTEEGRVLLIGVSRSTNESYGLVVPATVPLSRAIEGVPAEQQGVLKVWALAAETQADSRELLLQRLCEISRRDWIEGQRLTRNGLVSYLARNGGGYTLEAQLGIISNAKAGPDFRGWEVKQHCVGTLLHPKSGTVTLFDIAPDGGSYTELGATEFAKRHGRPRPSGDRFDFTGKHKASTRASSTGLHLEVRGYDDFGIDPFGGVELVNDEGLTAMSWTFSKLLGHWNRKHAQAVFIRSENRDVVENGSPTREYRYGSIVELGIGTDFSRFLSAIANGTIAFDPGLNAKLESSGHWKSHARFPFRISSRDLHSLYTNFEKTETCTSL
jgi:hypothetical protein